MTPPGPDFVDPVYLDRSLGDVLPAIARALDVDAGLPATGIDLPPAPGYALFLIDGLGYRLLEAHAAQAPFLASLLRDSAPATVGVPSTTATSLTSLGTARPPGEHGVVGFTSRIPGTERLLNALQWPKSVDPRQWQPHETALGKLARAGVVTTVVNKREFEGSGLTVAGQRGADFVGADRVGERIAAVLTAAGRAPSLTYLYDGDLDWTGHRHGVGSPAWRMQLAIIDAAAEQLREALPDHVRLVVVADHGMVDSPRERRVDVATCPQLRDGVALLGGEARLRHLYCRGGAVDDVVAAWGEQLGADAEVLTRDAAIARGWFGAVEDGVRPRIGDVLVACGGDFSIMDSDSFPYETRLVGLHGSLTDAEMLIPLLVS